MEMSRYCPSSVWRNCLNSDEARLKSADLTWTAKAKAEVR